MNANVLAPRVICYHKQNTSARTRFLCYDRQSVLSVLSGVPLPVATLQVPTTTAGAMGTVRPHPAQYLQALEEYLQLPAGGLRADAEFYAELVTAAGSIAVLLAEFTALDPPFAAATAIGARFIALTEARNLPAIELELLKAAYEHVLG